MGRDSGTNDFSQKSFLVDLITEELGQQLFILHSYPSSSAVNALLIISNKGETVVRCLHIVYPLVWRRGISFKRLPVDNQSQQTCSI